jgi:transposase
MEKKQVKLRLKRVFSEEFKRVRVQEYESGKFTALEISRLYNVSYSVVYTWIYRYSAYNKSGLKIVEMSKSSESKIKELQKKIAELERMVGQKQIMIDYLETMMEVAKEELNIDIKKKFDTPRSKK